MLHIKVIAVGRLKERFWSDACAEYLKRLSAYASVEVVEVQDVDPATCGGIDQVLQREGEQILKAVPADCTAILLAIRAKETSSEQLATKIDEMMVGGVSNIAFIIGGSNGVSQTIEHRADIKLSFGPITLPHNLARVVLLEQLYRAFKIIRNEPYHK